MMLGEFISKALVMILGYAYPALECFKTLEKTRVDMDDLRFWCQYWIIVALLSLCERFGDVFISWVPLYEELKLAFVIYLWYPKTKGTSYVYETLLRPLVSKHETVIERHLKDLRFRAWDLSLYYWQNCTELGQGALFEVMDYTLSRSQRIKSDTISGAAAGVKQNKHNDERSKPPPMPMEYSPSYPSSFFKRWRPQPPHSTLYRSVSKSPKAGTVQLEGEEAQTEYEQVEEWAKSNPNGTPINKSTFARLRLRLTKNNP